MVEQTRDVEIFCFVLLMILTKFITVSVRNIPCAPGVIISNKMRKPSV